MDPQDKTQASHPAPKQQPTQLVPTKTNGLAITSLILSFFIPLVGLILAIVALSQIKKKQEGGKGLAIAGLIISIVVMLFHFLFLMILILGAMAEIQSTSTTGSTSSSSTSKPTPKSEYAVNEPVTIDDQTMTVTNVVRNFNTGNQFIQPESGKEYVVVTVQLQNNGKDQIRFNTYDFQVQDSNGVLKSEGFITGVENKLESGGLAPGGKVTGNIAFEVLKGDTGLKLIFKPSFWSNKTITVKL